MKIQRMMPPDIPAKISMIGPNRLTRALEKPNKVTSAMIEMA